MTINIRFGWDKDNLLSKMRDVEWFCTQVLLKGVIWVAHGGCHSRLHQLSWSWVRRVTGELDK